jgi:hypothetical protein
MIYERWLAQRSLQVFEECDSTFLCNWKAQYNAQMWIFSNSALAKMHMYTCIIYISA